MKIQLLGITIAIAIVAGACGEPAANTAAKASPNAAPPAVTASPNPALSALPANKDGDYDGKGVVTKIDLKLGSAEIDHEDIPNLMPPMRMEFYVSDKKLLDGLKVGTR